MADAQKIEILSPDALCALFDSFVKAGLKNKARYFCRTLANRHKHEIAAPIEQIDIARAREVPESNEKNVIVYANEEFEVQNPVLYTAMKRLPAEQRATLLLRFWRNMPYTVIAQKFCVSRKTVYNWREKAYEAIRRALQQNGVT